MRPLRAGMSCKLKDISERDINSVGLRREEYILNRRMIFIEYHTNANGEEYAFLDYENKEGVPQTIITRGGIYVRPNWVTDYCVMAEL